MRRALYIGLLVGVIILSLTGCDSKESEPEPAVNPAIIDWHLQLSTDSQSRLFRCSQVTSLDETRTLFDPLTVTAQATFVSPQMLDETLKVLNKTDADFGKTIRPQIETPTFIVVLFSVQFETERSIYEPFEISPTVYPNELHSLDEIGFQFGDPSTPASESIHLVWQGVDLTVEPSSLPSAPLQVGIVYPLQFSLNGQAIPEEMARRTAQLTVTISMISPLRFDFCDVGNSHVVNLNLPIVAGDAEAVMKNYGPLSSRVSPDRIESLRIALLTQVMDLYLPVAANVGN